MSSTESKPLLTASDLPERLSAALREGCRGGVARLRMSPEMSYGRHAGPAPHTARPAAVVLLLFRRAGRWHLPLTERPASLARHGGQISLPGGSMDPGESSSQAALRELNEELGVEGNVDLLGQLADCYVFASDFRITPWVAATSDEPRWMPHDREVQAVVELPIDVLLNQPLDQMTIERGPLTFRAPCIRAGSASIWGATSVILSELGELLRTMYPCPPHPVPSAMIPTTKLRAVVFDLDGLLVNSEDLYEQAGETVLRRRGKTYDAALREQMMGRPVVDALQLMIDCHSLSDSLEDLMCECKTVLETFMATSLASMPGVVELLDALEAEGVPVAVATSGTREYADHVLTRLNLKHRFRFILTADDIQRGKPDPEIYLLAAQRLGIAPSQMLVLEDSANGCRAAVAAGAFTVAVPNRHTRNHIFTGAQFIADTLADARIRQVLAI